MLVGAVCHWKVGDYIEGGVGGGRVCSTFTYNESHFKICTGLTLLAAYLNLPLQQHTRVGVIYSKSSCKYCSLFKYNCNYKYLMSELFLISIANILKIHMYVTYVIWCHTHIHMHTHIYTHVCTYKHMYIAITAKMYLITIKYNCNAHNYIPLGMLVGIGQFLWHVSCTWEVWRCSHNWISGPYRMTATNSIMTTPSHLPSTTHMSQHQLTFPGAVPHHTMISCSVSSVYTKFLVQSPSFSSVTTRRLHKPKYYGFILLK